ncbi:MAG: hypothetical protein GY798_15785 [Hyphomicrobiales bacterium]|nr:hypothetical protein [Hyphomicrobiales bacterium]
MRAFKLIEMDGALLVEISDNALAACFRALDYTWGHKASSQSVVAELNEVLNKHAATAASRPARTAKNPKASKTKEPRARSTASRNRAREALPVSMH